MKEIKYPGQELSLKITPRSALTMRRKITRQGRKVAHRKYSTSNEVIARRSFDMSLVLETLRNQNLGVPWQSFENQYYKTTSKSPQNIMLFGLIKPLQPHQNNIEVKKIIFQEERASARLYSSRVSSKNLTLNRDLTKN